MVTVTSATPQPPTVFPLMQCDAATADTITVGCLATGFIPSSLTYAWSKNGVALTDFIQYPPVLENNLYTGVSEIRVRAQDWDNKEILQCAVTHTAGNNEVNITKPTLFYQSPTLKVLASSDEENEASFSCFANDFSPNTFEFKWLKNDKDIGNKKYEGTTLSTKRKYENGTVVYSAASLLVVPSSEWTSGTTFTCQFKGKGETGATLMNSSVIPSKPPCGGCKTADVDITILGPRMEDIFKDSLGQIVCQVNVSKPSVSRIWWENEFGKELVSSPQDAIKITTGVFNLSLEITYEEWSQGVKRYCFVEHTEWVEPTKRPFERNAGEQTLRPSVFMLPPVQNSRKEMVTLTCYVKDFFPQDVLVTWLVDDEEAGPDYHFHTTNPVGHHGSYSAYAQLSLSLDQWQNDDVVYSCVVHHESVANRTKAIVRSVGYKTFEKTNLVNLNMNVPESCKAQ
uniref:immunoglobulin heavy constant mu isoform X4 n=1 Tax=Scatophagus argus TaxID=75038 RepID=UPI001ED83031|nr:immunoglobulin heavy constant mu isoform X4 [Scatophagus argus]